MKRIIILAFLSFFSFTSYTQIVDEIIAVVGDEVVLASDIETQYLQYLSQGYTDSEDVRCQIIEDVLYQKLLVHQAKLDSTDVSEDDVNQELDRRLSSFISELGSKEALEEYFKKSISELKIAFYDIIYNQLLTKRIQSSITSSVSITPEEVKIFFNQL